MRSRAGFARHASGWLSLLFWVAARAAEPAAREPHVLTVLGRDDPPYQQAMRGVREVLRRHAQIEQATLGNDPAQLRQSAARSSLTLAMGTRAAVAMQGHARPLLSCMILNTSVLPAGPEQYGVILQHAPAVQLAWIRRVLPRARRIGVLYNPQENQARIDAAALAARAAGLELLARPVEDTQDLPDALGSLDDRIDVLWGISDRLTLNPQTARHLLLFSYRHRIPLIGPSDAWVAAGALFALDWDFEDLGRQCAEAALLLLRGNRPQPAYAPPRKITYTINRRAAEQLHLKLAPDLLRGAARVHD